MDLRDYLRVIRRRWRLIAASTLGLMALAALVTLLMTPTYVSTARLFVSTAESDPSAAYQGSLLSAARVTSYADLAGSEELAKGVVAQLGLRVPPSEVASKITAGVSPSTVIVDLSAVDTSPRRAQRIAQAAAEQLSLLVAQLETPPGKARAPIKATIIDAASLPTAADSPRPKRNIAIGAMLGLLVGLGGAVLRELFDSSVKDPDDVAAVADVPVMGDIGYDPGAGKRPLVSDLEPHAPRVESFRVLRTNLQFADVDHNDSRVFTVTSSVPDEGKTATAMNLAITLAEAGERVLLLEADLRRPHIGTQMRLESSVGLTTVLLGHLALEDAVQECQVPNLSVLTSGSLPPNPAELLQSDKMADVLRQARATYDLTIVDTPPLLPVTDAALLAARSDGALLVVRHGKTRLEQLHQAVTRLDAVGGRTLGVLLNMVPRRHGHAYGYSYGYPAQPVVADPAPDPVARRRRAGRRSSATVDDLGLSRADVD